jgi:hypothetical protein
MATVFEPGASVLFVGHPEHVAPPIIAGMEGAIRGNVMEDIGGGLYRVNFPATACNVQLHCDQLQGAFR